MRRFFRACLFAATLLGGAVALSGCVVVAPRHARVWVPGYWAGGHIWVEGHYR